MKNILKFKLIPVLLVLVIVFASCTTKSPTGNGKDNGGDANLEFKASTIQAKPVEPGKGGDSSEDLRNSINELASKTSSILLKDKKENTVYSPVSLYYAVAMLREMADGETLSELDKFLHIEDFELAKSMKILIENEKFKGDLLINNSFWIDSKIKDIVNPDYLKLLSENYYAYVMNTDFSNDESYKDIDLWVNKLTNNMLEYDSKELFADANLVSVLINTVYFNSTWETEFNKDRNYKDMFNNLDGSQTEIEFMKQINEEAEFKISETYEAAELKLKNGSMHFILPKEGTDINELLKDEKFFTEYLKQEKLNGKLVIDLPKFEIETTYEQLLDNLGLAHIIGEGSNPNFSKGYINGHRGLEVSSITQKAKIIVNEKGAEASAATAVAIKESAALQEKELYLTLNKPFIYLITLESGEILFVGTAVSFN